MSFVEIPTPRPQVPRPEPAHAPQRQRAGLPAARPPLAVEDRDPAGPRQHHRDGMVRHLLDAVVGDVGAIGWKVGNGPGNCNEFAETAATLLKAVTQCAQANAEGGFRKLYRTAIVLAKTAAPQQIRITQQPILQLCLRCVREYIESCAA